MMDAVCKDWVVAPGRRMTMKARIPYKSVTFLRNRNMSNCVDNVEISFNKP